MFIVPEITAAGWLVYALLFFGLYVTVVVLLIFFENVGKLEEGQKERKAPPADLPSLTILIPAFNEQDSIAESIERALASDYPQDSLYVMVVDDGSQDRTGEIVEGFADRGVTLIQKPNSGKAASVNYGLARVQTPYVLIIDADTNIRPDAAAIMMEYLLGDPEAAAVVPTVHIHDPSTLLERIQMVEYSIGNFFRRMFASIGSFSLVPACVAAGTKEIIALGGFNEDTLTEDLEMGLRIKLSGRQILHATEAIVLTRAPDTMAALQKQRLRWQYGGYENVIKYRNFMFNREYADFGMFGFPVFVLSRFVTLAFLLLISASIASAAARHLRMVYWAGAGAYVARMLALPSFALPMSPVSYVLAVGFAFNLAFFLLAVKYTRIKGNIPAFLIYIFLFWMVFAFFSLKALILFIIRLPPGWKAPK